MSELQIPSPFPKKKSRTLLATAQIVDNQNLFQVQLGEVLEVYSSVSSVQNFLVNVTTSLAEIKH